MQTYPDTLPIRPLERAPDDKATNESLVDYFQSHGDAERARYHREKSR